MSEPRPEILTADDIQSFLRISRSSVYNLLNRKDFPTLSIGSRKLVMKDDLMKWLAEHTNK